MRWTVDTLKEHFDQRLADMDKAVLAAREESKEWKAQSNEWRATMNDKDERFALKTETGRMRDDITRLQLSEATLAGKASMNSVYISLLASAISIGIAIVALFIK